MEALSHLNFYTETTAFIGPEAPLDQGGIVAAMVGTLEQVAISVVISVPLGIATAVYLSEVRGRLARAGAHRRRGDERRPDHRGRPVHLLHADPQARPGAQRLRGVAGAVREHDPGRHARRPRWCCGWCPTACARRRWPSAPRSGRPCAGWCCPRRGPAWSPPSCSAWPGSSARPRRSCSSPARPTSSTPTRCTARSSPCRCSSSPRCKMPLDIAIARAFGACVVLLVARRRPVRPGPHPRRPAARPHLRRRKQRRLAAARARRHRK